MTVDPEEPVTISCATCGGYMLTVPRRVAEAFSSGTWACASEACSRKRTAAVAAAEGRML